jgi:hypothetical protein
MKNTPKSQGLGQYKTNNRWKWMAGATATAAAAATSAQANTVTMTLSNNYISVADGNHLSADIFGNGNIFSFSRIAYRGSRYFGTVTFNIQTFKGAGNSAFARAEFDVEFAEATINTAKGASTNQTDFSYNPVQVTLQVPIKFMDPSVNGGAVTDGLLTITSAAQGIMLDPGPGSAQITLDSFSYEVNTSVPEGGSTLALLALGAGGVIALRQRRKTA